MSQRDEAAMIVRFIAVLLTGLAMIAPGAHLFELFRKMRLAEDQYYVVQQIYLGWWLVVLLLPAALIANVVMAVTSSGTARWLAVVAAGLVALNLLVFVIWTQPVNTVTDNWAVHLPQWEALRRQWEYSHAVNAGITFAAFCAATLAALRAN
jgi:hypothetical protein